MQSTKLSKWFSGVTVALALVTAAAAQRQAASLDQIAFQFDNQPRQQASSSIVGAWHQTRQAQDGGVVHTYWMYNTDGTFLMTSVQVGGPLGGDGTRTQFWGRYQAQQQQNGSVDVIYQVAGRAPLQTCVQGQGCRSAGPTPPSAMRDTYQIRGNTALVDGSVLRRDTVPQALRAQLPANWIMQPPPPIPSSRASVGPGDDSNSPKHHVPGQGGTCDNAQQERVCTINDGHLWEDSHGCEHCVRSY